MMPLSMATPGEAVSVKKVGGKEEIHHFLESLGFVTGSSVTVVSKIAGNVIVQVKDSRIAISQEMASKIFV